MLEFWYREKRTLVDFRRGPLGPYFDGFAARLRALGYSPDWGKGVLGKCCQFNGFLIEQGITSCHQITESLIEPFLALYLDHSKNTSPTYSPRRETGQALKRLLLYLAENALIRLHKPKRIPKPYDWLLDPYILHLEKESGLAKVTIGRARVRVSSFLDTLGQNVLRSRFKALRAPAVERCLSRHLKTSSEDLGSLGGTLRRFFRYCAVKGHASMDFSGLIPPVRRYRNASLPKGLEDSALEHTLEGVDTDTPTGARDYAIMVLMMAYGLRGISVAALLLDDINWKRSQIRIRAQKGGKEVLVPLMESVGDAIIQYLRHRPSKTPFREVFLTVNAPLRPLTTLAISHVVRGYMKKVGITTPGAGSRTLRHSWAIRALANDSPIKSIADVLGHRYIDTTFIYAVALRSLGGA
jgi:integrase/recombinase XerD